MKNVGLVGWNGKFNVGDDAMTAVIIKYLSTYGGYKNFQLLSDENSLAQYADSNSSISIKGMPFYGQIEKIPYLKTIIKHYIFPYAFSSNKEILLLGGGSIFHREKLSKFYLRLINQTRKKNPLVLIGAIGVSIGPFKNNKEIEAAKLSLGKLDFIVVRDKRSYDLAIEFGLKKLCSEAPDLALLLPQITNIKFPKIKTEKFIGISLRANHLSPQKVEWLAKIIEKLLSQNPSYKCKLFNFCDLINEQDLHENKKLINAIDSKMAERFIIVNYSKDPVDFYQEINSCDLMVCMRLHAAIISYAVDTKFSILSYHQKCLDFADEVGLPANYILNENSSVEDSCQKLQKMLQESSINFSKQKDIILERAKTHFSFLKELKTD